MALAVYMQVRERDKGCRLCGRHDIQAHHIIYRSHGGTNDIRNLICLCVDCHSRVHSDEKYWVQELLNMQYDIYGRFDTSEIKKHNKWERS